MEKVSNHNEDILKTHSDKYKLRDLLASRTIITEILKEVLQAEGKHYLLECTCTGKNKNTEIVINLKKHHFSALNLF